MYSISLFNVSCWYHFRLLVVVRDPVTRAISDYTQAASKRKEMKTFEELAFLNQTTGKEFHKEKIKFIIIETFVQIAFLTFEPFFFFFKYSRYLLGTDKNWSLRSILGTMAAIFQLITIFICQRWTFNRWPSVSWNFFKAIDPFEFLCLFKFNWNSNSKNIIKIMIPDLKLVVFKIFSV